MNACSADYVHLFSVNPRERRIYVYDGILAEKGNDPFSRVYTKKNYCIMALGQKLLFKYSIKKILCGVAFGFIAT